MKELFEAKQEVKRRKEEEELKSLKNEADIWKFINKKRKKKGSVENNVTAEGWRSYFMKLLEGEDKNEEIRNQTEDNLEYIEDKEGQVADKLEDEEITSARE